MTAAAAQPAQLLAELLAAEADALAHLHYRVAQAAGLAAAGHHRFLAPAADEVLAAVDDLGGVELARALVAADAAAEWGLASDTPSLEELVAAAPPAWQGALAVLAERIRGLVAAVDAAATLGERAATGGLRRVRANLVAVPGGAASYDPEGVPEPAA